jgi:hypothetical protein
VIGNLVKVNRSYLISRSRDGGQEPKALHDTRTFLSVRVEWKAREAQLTRESNRDAYGFRWLIVLVIMDLDLAAGVGSETLGNSPQRNH